MTQEMIIGQKNTNAFRFTSSVVILFSFASISFTNSLLHEQEQGEEWVP